VKPVQPSRGHLACDLRLAVAERQQLAEAGDAVLLVGERGEPDATWRV
jgi:hypothetical protein